MSHPFALYNPALLPPEVLLSEYSARLPLLETLLGIVRSNQPGHPPQHCLLIGARGMGKTTTLWAVAHKISRDYELARQWQPVVFDEESRRVGDLADFWLEAIRQWEFATKATTDLTGPLLAQNPPDIEERAHRLFTDLVTRSGKRVVLLIDNLNDLLASIRDAEPLHRLRAALMQDSGIMLIGGATSHFEHVTSVDQPFYDFFRIFELKPLTLDDMHECLQTLAKSRGDAEVEKALVERSGSIQGLHILTGGNPRLIKTFYRLLREGLQTDIRADLEKLLDEFTPYFKSIVDALSGQQQRILDAVALAWKPVEVAAIAKTTRLTPSHVSAQLGSLIRLGVLREAAGHPKKKTYLLADRFSNIHYLMRHGRAAKNRMDWFVETIRAIFPDKISEIIAKLAHDAAERGSHGMVDARDVLHSAFTRSATTEDRRNLLLQTLAETWSEPAMESLNLWFDVESAKKVLPDMDMLAFCQNMPRKLRQDLGFKPESPLWWYRLTEFLVEKQMWVLVEAAQRKAIALAPKEAWPWYELGKLMKNVHHKYQEAEVAFRTGLENDPRDAYCWTSLGNLFLENYKMPAEAESAYREAISIDPKLPHAWNGLGNALFELDRNSEAEEVYRKAIKLDSYYALAWNGLGTLLKSRLMRYNEAEDAYRKAIEYNPKYASAWNNLGNLLLDHLKRPAEAVSAYRAAIKLDHLYAAPWSGLAEALSMLPGNNIEARKCAATALPLKPEYGFARHIFAELCSRHASDWETVLPSLVNWCAENPKHPKVFSFTISGLVMHAHLTSPVKTIAFINQLVDPTPFAQIADALIAFNRREHLHKLAPEVQAVAVELMRRIQKGSEFTTSAEAERIESLDPLSSMVA